MWKLYTCPTCFRHFWKNKQVHICNYKVKNSHVSPSANLANWVLKQSALMLLSKSTLWSLNQSLHLGKIKKYNKKSKWIWNQSGLSWQCSDSELLCCLCIPDLEGCLQSMHLYTQNLLNLYLRGRMSTVQHPVQTWISGTTFSWKVSHWPCHLVLPPLS